MDINALVGPPEPDNPDGPTTRQTISYLKALDDLDDATAVLAVVAVQMSRSFDRMVRTGVGLSTISNVSRQIRETISDIRNHVDPVAVQMTPFERAQAAALGAVTPSLFSAPESPALAADGPGA